MKQESLSNFSSVMLLIAIHLFARCSSTIMSINDLSGWAIRRNGSCHEKDCGPTEAPYHACCPFGTECSNPYNQNCCPAGTNCTVALVESPRCANESWSMYDNYGFFCCEEGQVGYGRGNTDGCSKSGASLPEDASPISLVNQGISTRLRICKLWLN